MNLKLDLVTAARFQKLGIDPAGKTTHDLKKMLKRLVFSTHPDKNQGQSKEFETLIEECKALKKILKGRVNQKRDIEKSITAVSTKKYQESLIGNVDLAPDSLLQKMNKVFDENYERRSRYSREELEKAKKSVIVRRNILQTSDERVGDLLEVSGLLRHDDIDGTDLTVKYKRPPKATVADTAALLARSLARYRAFS